MASIQQWTLKMAPEDKTFYAQLGQKIARYRKAQGLTQVQLAEILGVAQQTMAHYEGGHLRIAVAMLSPLANALSVPVEELIDETLKTKKKRGPTSILQRQIEQVGLMPRAKQKFIIEMLDGLIKQQQSVQG